jgi:hypothetical protein
MFDQTYPEKFMKMTTLFIAVLGLVGFGMSAEAQKQTDNTGGKTVAQSSATGGTTGSTTGTVPTRTGSMNGDKTNGVNTRGVRPVPSVSNQR